MLRVFEDEAGAAHELLAHLLAAFVGEVVSGDDKSLPAGNVLADLMHLTVHRPPLRLALRFLVWQRRAARGGAVSPPHLLMSEKVGDRCEERLLPDDAS